MKNMDHKHMIAFALGLALGYLVLPMVVNTIRGALSSQKAG